MTFRAASQIVQFLLFMWGEQSFILTLEHGDNELLFCLAPLGEKEATVESSRSRSLESRTVPQDKRERK